MFFNKYVYLCEFVSFFIMYQYDSLAPFQLKHEFTMVVAGPSKSGKTEFVKNLIILLLPRGLYGATENGNLLTNL